MSKVFNCVILLVILTSCASPARVAKESAERFASLTSDFVQKCATSSEFKDPPETILVLSTVNCYERESGIFRADWNDRFLRAYVSKRDKTLLFVQAYNIIIRTGHTWSAPYQASYLMDGRQYSEDGTWLAADADCTFSRVKTRPSPHGTWGAQQRHRYRKVIRGCQYREEYGFNLDLAIFDEARRLKSEGAQTFNYRIRTSGAGVLDWVFHVEEIIGLEEKIKSTISGL